MTNQKLQIALKNHGIKYQEVDGLIIADDISYNRHTDKTIVEQKVITGMSIKELMRWLGY